MKKLFFILLTGMLFSCAESRAQQVFGGLVFGVNGSQVAGDVASGYDKAGIHAGIFAYTHLSEKSVFQMELVYSQKGARKNPSEKNGYQQYLLRLNYIDLPFIYKYIYNEQLSFEAGLSYGYLLYHYEEANFSLDVGDAGFHQHALNILVGINYRFAERWAAGLRSTNSLYQVRDHVSGASRFPNYGQYNDVLTLSFQYFFGAQE
ncbi:MAG: porin family protein [Bacteroidales bacterium]